METGVVQDNGVPFAPGYCFKKPGFEPVLEEFCGGRVSVAFHAQVRRDAQCAYDVYPAGAFSRFRPGYRLASRRSPEFALRVLADAALVHEHALLG